MKGVKIFLVTAISSFLVLFLIKIIFHPDSVNKFAHQWGIPDYVFYIIVSLILGCWAAAKGSSEPEEEEEE